jgi:lon-related putative ATP-dependent protease
MPKLTKPKKIKPISWQEARWNIKKSSPALKKHAEEDGEAGIIGQNEALTAIRLGIELESPGYNIYITGPSGTGKASTVKALLKKVTEPRIALVDQCFVQNFLNPEQPKLLTLPKGEGARLSKDMDELIEILRKTVPTIFEDAHYESKRSAIVKEYDSSEKKLFQDFSDRAANSGFALTTSSSGAVTQTDLHIVFDGQPYDMETLNNLHRTGQLVVKNLEEVETTYDALREQLEQEVRSLRGDARKMYQKLNELEREVGMRVVGGLTEDIKERWEVVEIQEYLDAARDHIAEHLEIFYVQDGVPSGEEEGESAPPAIHFQSGVKGGRDDLYKVYRVNIILDNTHTDGCPVIWESNPTYASLFGYIEKEDEEPHMGAFNRIRGGSFLKAHGGYIVINSSDIFSDPSIWQKLKRTLKDSKLEVRSPEMSPINSLKPQAVPVNVKAIVIGDSDYFDDLWDMDLEFRRTFKVKAEFNFEMENSDENIANHAAFIRQVCTREKMLNPSADAIAEIIEQGIRIAGHNKNLTSRFGLIADMVREAHYWATLEKSKKITSKHVQKSMRQKVLRHNLDERRYQQDIELGVYDLELEGFEVGRVNALPVYDLGDHEFCRPSRISASCGVGQTGIVSIEREIRLSGASHSKGILTLVAYLRSLYATKRPLTLSATVTFEQSHSGIDGDSASAAEGLALLSALAGLGIDQGIGITGALNQNGEVHPIGGVNTKIEGFFKACQYYGLTGKQGVIIPYKNKDELMLNTDVVAAVKAKKFSIWPVKHIDEAIEILTDVKSGVEAPGKFTVGSFHAAVGKRLSEIADSVREFYYN